MDLGDATDAAGFVDAGPGSGGDRDGSTGTEVGGGDYFEGRRLRLEGVWCGRWFGGG